MKNRIIALVAGMLLLLVSCLKGNPFLPNVKVNQANHDFTCWPSISISPSGIVYVSYEVWIGWIPPDSTHIYLNRSYDGGNTFDPDRRIIKGEKYAENLSILVNKNEKIHLLYRESPNLATDDKLIYSNSSDSGQSFLVRTQVDDNPTPIPIGLADIAVNDSGDIYVVWNDARSINFYSHIYFARSTDGGLSFPYVVRVDTGEISKEGFHPSITLDNNGTIFITWMQQYSGNQDIYMCKSTDQGNSFTGMVRVDTFSIYTYAPDISVVGTDTIYICYITLSVSPSLNSLFISRSIDGGSTFANTVRINDSVFSHCDKPSICNTNDDRIHVIWEMLYDPLKRQEINADIYYDFSDDGSLNFNEDVMVNDDLSDSTRELASLSKDIDGNIYVAWIDWRSGYDIYSARTDFQGITEFEEMPTLSTRVAARPNPFTSMTTIDLLGVSMHNKHNLTIYDASGRRVRDFILFPSSFFLRATWDGCNENGKVVAPGVYFLKLNGKPVGKVVKVR
jgi:hypothetical protein